MKKIKVLMVLIGISIGYLLIQFFFLKNVSRQREDVLENGNDSAADRIPELKVSANAIIDAGKVAYDNVNVFLNVCDIHKLTVFLIDPDVLSAVMSNTSTTTSCKYLCQNMPLMTFAVMYAKLRPVQDDLILNLRSEGFHVTYYQDEDPRLLSLSVTSREFVPTHYLIYRTGHFIQLVVFQERMSGFWWHGKVEATGSWLGDPVHFEFSNLKFGHHAGAFDKMEILKVEMDGLKVNAPRYPTTFLDQLKTSTFLECNYTRARSFYKKYPRDESPDAMLFRKKGRILMNVAKTRVLDPLKARFWLSSGTCLGWYRQCDIIPYSKDVDFGILIKDYDVRLIAAMQMNDMPLKHLFGKPEDSFELSFQGADVKLDMFFFYEESNYMWNGGTQARTGKKFKYLFPKFTLCWTEFMEMKIRVPCETLSYIEANYGKDWYHPVKQWDWKRSPPNVRENGIWHESEKKRVIQHFDVPAT